MHGVVVDEVEQALEQVVLPPGAEQGMKKFYGVPAPAPALGAEKHHHLDRVGVGDDLQMIEKGIDLFQIGNMAGEMRLGPHNEDILVAFGGKELVLRHKAGRRLHDSLLAGGVPVDMDRP